MRIIYFLLYELRQVFCNNWVFIPNPKHNLFRIPATELAHTTIYKFLHPLQHHTTIYKFLHPLQLCLFEGGGLTGC